jgi:hypothetical protein
MCSSLHICMVISNSNLYFLALLACKTESGANPTIVSYKRQRCTNLRPSKYVLSAFLKQKIQHSKILFISYILERSRCEFSARRSWRQRAVFFLNSIGTNSRVGANSAECHRCIGASSSRRRENLFKNWPQVNKVRHVWGYLSRGKVLVPSRFPL